MSNIIKFPKRKNEEPEEIDFSEAVKTYYEGLAEPDSVINYAIQCAKNCEVDIDDGILFSIDISSIENETESKNVYAQIQSGIENLCMKYNSELLKLRIKLVNAQVKLYKLENGL